MAANLNSFGARAQLTVGANTYDYFRLDAVPGSDKLPFSLKVLLENLLRNEDGIAVTRTEIEALGNWDPTSEPEC
jgi:aconitate hydratase